MYKAQVIMTLPYSSTRILNMGKAAGPCKVSVIGTLLSTLLLPRAYVCQVCVYVCEVCVRYVCVSSVCVMFTHSSLV